MPDNSKRDKRIEEALSRGLKGKAFDDFVFGAGKAPGVDDTPPAILPKDVKPKVGKAKVKDIKVKKDKPKVKDVKPITIKRKPVAKPVIGSKKELEEARRKRLIKMRRRAK